MNTVKQIVQAVVPGHCYNDFFVNFNFFNVECIKIIISKLLGMGIIVGSAFVKVPQIVKLLQAQSAEGISVTSVLLELFSMTVSAAYSFARGFPFSSWGESLFMMLETATIAYLVFLYSGKRREAVIFVGLYLLLTYGFFAGLLPSSFLWACQAFNLPLAISGKLLQAFRNYENGSTGQLSAITIGLLVLGTVARVFTTIQETGDPLLVVTFIAAALANGLLAFQVYYYWDTKGKSRTKDPQDSREKEDKKAL